MLSSSISAGKIEPCSGGCADFTGVTRGAVVVVVVVVGHFASAMLASSLMLLLGEKLPLKEVGAAERGGGGAAEAVVVMVVLLGVVVVVVVVVVVGVAVVIKFCLRVCFHMRVHFRSKNICSASTARAPVTMGAEADHSMTRKGESSDNDI
jgi:hypothetical protein